MQHVQRQHVAQLKTRRLEREYARTSTDSTEFLDDQPFWEGRVPWPRGGPSLKHQREKEAQKRREEETACSSPVSSSSCVFKRDVQVKRLRLAIGTVRPLLPCGGVALSASLAFEDALVEEGTKKPEYWMIAWVMAESLHVGWSVVAYRTLPLMRPGR